MGRTTWLIEQRKLSKSQREELAQRWMKSLMSFAHGELMQFDQVRVHEQIDTGILASDVMMQLLDSWRSGRQPVAGGKQGFARLCRKMIRNDLTDYSRKIHRKMREAYRNRESLDQRKEDTGGELEAIEADNRRREVAIKWLDASLKKLENEMPEHYGVLVKRFFCGASLREIGDSIGKNKDTVRKMLIKAEEWLVDELPEDCVWLS